MAGLDRHPVKICQEMLTRLVIRVDRIHWRESTTARDHLVRMEIASAPLVLLRPSALDVSHAVPNPYTFPVSPRGALRGKSPLSTGRESPQGFEQSKTVPFDDPLL